MNRKFLMRFGEADNDIDRIIGRSSKAVCGITERELNVRSENVAKTKATLRARGFVIIGTSEPHGSFRKIWFIRAGGF